ncbi:MAG: DNA repair protein RecO [Deltaproteobacteria bacterium]|nr:DNA repair protein RecO [Deltaproteobacteria bacterium]
MATRELEALVVGSIEYGESDRIVRLLTREGRISAFAHGAKRSTRRFGGALEPFSTVRVELDSRRDGLSTLSSALVVRPRLALTSELDRLALASYVVELALLMTPEAAPSTEVFEHVESALETLMSRPASITFRVAYELMLLSAVGYRPELKRCARCDAELSENPWVDLLEGGALCELHRRGRKIGPKTIAWMRAVLDAEISDPTAGLDAAWANTAAERALPILTAARRTLLSAMPKSEGLLETVGLDGRRTTR